MAKLTEKRVYVLPGDMLDLVVANHTCVGDILASQWGKQFLREILM